MGTRQRGISRRSALIAAGVVGAGLTGAGFGWYRGVPRQVALRSATAAFTGPGSRALVDTADVAALYPGSRVLRSAVGAERLLRQEQEWFATGADWTLRPGRHADLLRCALLDLRVLLLPNGAALAGWSSPWRYVWPRDAAFAAAALSATGHLDDACRVLQFLDSNLPDEGWLESRYRPDGSGTPDARAKQLDSFGWVLWSAGQLAADWPGDAAELLQPVASLLRHCAAGSIAAVDNEDALPPPSPDYWEKREFTQTLGIAAPLLAGLRTAAKVLPMLGSAALGTEATRAAYRLQTAIHGRYGADGYPRSLGRRARDTSVAFLLPPFADTVHPDVAKAAAAARFGMARPAGGIAPGESWPQDGVSWTPQTALFGLTDAAMGDRTKAIATLDWLSEHRTSAGSLPEKVLFDGSPADVAPLSWTASTVLLTLAKLRKLT
ncbi:glycoside hydrolase family 15 [Saxibacter everestensis]|uniref:Glycoside hydrolase family 15 n=1 Tax=Saxibacter everestensis TaxID=2909229 RepID=A0ABY8QXM0_9MICO|nr:glycoside hydrolase family 15 [Brevibacteriaceae bacterium ZFBP1038]